MCKVRNLCPHTNEEMEAKSESPITQEEQVEGIPQLENVPTCSGYSVGPNYLEDRKLEGKSRDYLQFLTREIP